MRYLLVAHQTADSPELCAAARRMQEDDPDGEFVLLVPATPVSHLLVWEEGETAAIATASAEAGRRALTAHGVRVAAVRVGDAEPVSAVLDELRRWGQVSGIVVCTLPAAFSRWLRMDVPSRVRRSTSGITVQHVVARGTTSRVPVTAVAGGHSAIG